MLTKHWWNIGQAGYEDSKRWWWWSSDFSGKIINPSLHICHHSVCDPDPNPCRWTWPLLILATRIPIQIMTNPTLSSWSLILILILTDEADQPRLVGWQRCQLPCHPHSTHWTDTHWWLSTQFSPSSNHCHPEHPASVCLLFLGLSASCPDNSLALALITPLSDDLNTGLVCAKVEGITVLFLGEPRIHRWRLIWKPILGSVCVKLGDISRCCYAGGRGSGSGFWVKIMCTKFDCWKS